MPWYAMTSTKLLDAVADSSSMEQHPKQERAVERRILPVRSSIPSRNGQEREDWEWGGGVTLAPSSCDWTWMPWYAMTWSKLLEAVACCLDFRTRL